MVRRNGPWQWSVAMVRRNGSRGETLCGPSHLSLEGELKIRHIGYPVILGMKTPRLLLLSLILCGGGHNLHALPSTRNSSGRCQATLHKKAKPKKLNENDKEILAAQISNLLNQALDQSSQGLSGSPMEKTSPLVIRQMLGSLNRQLKDQWGHEFTSDFFKSVQEDFIKFNGTGVKNKISEVREQDLSFQGLLNDALEKINIRPHKIFTIQPRFDFIMGAHFNGDGSEIFAPTSDRTIAFWRTLTGEPVANLSYTSEELALDSVSFRDEDHLLVRLSNAQVIVLNVRQEDSFVLSSNWAEASESLSPILGILNSKKVFTRTEEKNQVRSMALSSHFKRVAISYNNGSVELFDGVTFKKQWRKEESSAAVVSMTFSPDSEHLMVLTNQGTVEIWDVERGVIVSQYTSLAQSGGIGAFHKKHPWFIARFREGETVVYDWLNKKIIERLQFKTHSSPLVSFSPVDDNILTLSDEGGIGFYDLSSGKKLKELVPAFKKRENSENEVGDHQDENINSKGNNEIKEWSLSPSGRFVYALSEKGFFVWETQSGRSLVAENNYGQRLFNLEFSSDESLFLITRADRASGRRVIDIWQTFRTKTDGDQEWVQGQN